jgi:hypothetical protein
MNRFKQKLLHTFVLTGMLFLFAMPVVSQDTDPLTATARTELSAPPQLMGCSSGSDGSCSGG